MGLDAIGAGLGRTGTQSLKLALERLLAAPCYDMTNLMLYPDQTRVWSRALDGLPVEWDALFSGYRSAVDTAAALLFEELADAYPEAIVVLSLRDPDAWWRSFDETVVAALEADPPDDPLTRAWAPSREFTLKMLATRLTPDWADEAAAKEAYERHNSRVRATIDPDRLVEWRPEEGWGPLCAGLAVSVPAEPFPRINTSADFRSRFNLGPLRDTQG